SGDPRRALRETRAERDAGDAERFSIRNPHSTFRNPHSAFHIPDQHPRIPPPPAPPIEQRAGKGETETD
ncbi:MAG: hypothetical protein ACKO9H_16335, partial [Planctomycetota bacterium]